MMLSSQLNVRKDSERILENTFWGSVPFGSVLPLFCDLLVLVSQGRISQRLELGVCGQELLAVQTR